VLSSETACTVVASGEKFVYSLQYILKNWFDFSDYQNYKDRYYNSESDQRQIWLQNILKDEAERENVVKLFR
jgi:hypothetical protein